MRVMRLFGWVLVWCGLAVAGARAQTPQYMPFEFDGQKVNARPLAYKDAYIQLALQGGGYTNVAWGRLSQDTLKALQKLRNYGAYATPFIDPAPMPPPAGPKISLKPVERPERPVSGGLFASPVMWLVFFLLYLGNIYAGYEVAVFRQRNVGLVCGLSAVAPILGPIIFLALPAYEEPVVEEESAEGAAAVPDVVALPSAEGSAAAPEAAPAAAAPVGPPVVSYQRGRTTFNRKFFETKLAGFLKMAPGEAEKDQVLVIVSTRGTFVGTRFTRLSPTDLTLHVVKGNASQDVPIAFTEINEVRVQHKSLPV